MKIREMRQSHIFEMRMVQNLNFSVKKAQFWLVPILVLAGLFSWAHVQGGGQSQAQPVKTELVVSTSKSKATKILWFTIAKRFAPSVTAPTEEYAARIIQGLWVNQASTYSRIKSNLLFASYFWKPRSSASFYLC
jgi:hypothetical protein